MQRWVLALAVLLTGALTVAHADYIRITYNLAPATDLPQGAAALGPRQGQPPAPGGEEGGGGGGGPPGGLRPGARQPRGRPPATPGQQAVQLPDDDANPMLASAVIEYTKSDTINFRSGGRFFPRIYHHLVEGGKTGITETGDLHVTDVKEHGVNLPTVKERYKHKRAELLKDAKGDDRTDKLLEVAKWAINHQLLKEFEETMDELTKAKPDHAAARAYEKVKKSMATALTRDEGVKFWREHLGSNYKVRQTPHYNIVNNLPSGSPEELESYATRVEEVYRGFLYWFALKGIALPLPEGRMVAILIDRPGEFHARHAMFNQAPIVADGFFVRQYDLPVFSATRLDPAYLALSRSMQELWQNNWSKSDLLKGKGHAGAQPEEVVKNQMLALLQKAMQEESVLATVSHLGSVQLATATGLLPPHVEVPRWVEFGVGSFFETPKGAYWPGLGAPSWRYLVRLKAWEDAQKLDPPADALRSVVTDRYFRQALGSGDKAAYMKASAMSWALMYFLAESKIDGLMRYFEELGRLPRDLQIDDESLLQCFARALELTDPATPHEINQARVAKLADEWYSFMHYTGHEVSDAFKDALDEYKENVQRRAGRRPASGGKQPQGQQPGKPVPGRPAGAG